MVGSHSSRFSTHKKYMRRRRRGRAVVCCPLLADSSQLAAPSKFGLPREKFSGREGTGFCVCVCAMQQRYGCRRPPAPARAQSHSPPKLAKEPRCLLLAAALRNWLETLLKSITTNACFCEHSPPHYTAGQIAVAIVLWSLYFSSHLIVL